MLLHVHASDLRHTQRAHIILTEPCLYAHFVKGVTHITCERGHLGVLAKKVTKAYGALSCVPRWELDAFVTLSKCPQVFILNGEDPWQ